MPFGALGEDDFFGRREELSDLYRRAVDAERGVMQSLFLAGSRGTGKTELLRQHAGALFWKQDRVAPFFYTVSPALLSAADFSRDYITRFFCQRIAFESRDQDIASLAGVSLDEVSSLARSRGAAWAQDIIDRYARSAESPLDALRIALSAPHQSALRTGKPVVVMIDEFQDLRGLRRDGGADPSLISLFEEAFASPAAPHVVAGNEAEIRELPVFGSLGNMTLAPLEAGAATELFLSLLRSRGVALPAASPSFISRLGGNPLAIRRCALSLEPREPVEEKDLWTAYVREVLAGGIAAYWLSPLKKGLPDLNLRRTAIELAYAVHHAGHPLALGGIPRTLPVSGERVEPLVNVLYRAGFVRAEFGVVSAPDDPVPRDVVEGLYLREILGKSLRDVEREFGERLMPAARPVESFALTLPATKEAELVAVKCLEQIGKNHRFDEEAIGKLQMALIEACINAAEHGAGPEGKVYVNFDVHADRIEAVVESAGREFIVRETGEPHRGKHVAGETGRGWGIKLMKQFVDSVRFEKTARGSRVVLVKHLKTSAEDR